MNWVSVKDRLPEGLEDVYIWPPIEFEDYIYTAHFEPSEDRWIHHSEYGVDEVKGITHWAKIEPPEES